VEEVIYGRPEWWDQAACRGRHDLLDAFVPEGSNPHRAYREHRFVPPELHRLCTRCPVSEVCRASGERDRYAIRGGKTAQERNNERKKERRIDVRANHRRRDPDRDATD
jgi:hypothetical protein